MAKNAIWIKLLVGIGIALLAFASGYGMLKNKVSQNKEEIKDVKAEGCIPARKNTLNIALVQKDIETIQGDVSDMKTEQSAAFKEILKRLPE